MRVIGIDPGLATVGIGIVEAENRFLLRALDWCAVRTKPGDLGPRLAEIQADLEQILDEQTPDLAVIERLFFAANEQSAIEVAHARGVLVALVSKRGIPILEPTPLQLKLTITGDGHADKRQMQEMVQRLLKLPELPEPVDAADALGLAIYGVLQG